jgi:hypothetical protein
MKPDIIQLNLSKHCIKTELKRLYNETLSILVGSAAPDPYLEKRYQNLVAALENLDFQKLRGENPQLAGGSQNIKIELVFSEKGNISILIDGDKVEMDAERLCKSK